MKRRNITLSLPEDLLREAKIAAARRHSSVSAVLTDLLTRFVEEETGRRRAQSLFDEVTSTGLTLGTHGRPTWSRDELHDR